MGEQIRNSRNYHIVVLGDEGVGKTSLLITYMLKSFPEGYVPSVLDCYSVSIPYEQPGGPHLFSLFDTTGPEDLALLHTITYPLTDLFLLCFALDSRASFDRLATKWIPQLVRHWPRVPLILVGTKADTVAAPVTRREAERAAKQMGASGYVECSAIYQEGLDDVFHAALRCCLDPSTGRTVRLAKDGVRWDSCLPGVRLLFARHPQRTAARRLLGPLMHRV